MEMLGIAIWMMGVGMFLTGGFWMIVAAFRESAGCGLLFLFIPFYSPYYLVRRWRVMYKPFIIFVLGIIALVVGNDLMNSLQRSLSSST